MHILVTNDDGVYAPGLLALAQAFRSLGDVTILAPDKNWSASGHVKTMHRPLRAWETQLRDGTPALTSDGAPSDCVAIAILGMVEQPIDLVVSGINPNANVGHDVTYSGTVTAAMEAAISGLPGFAYSINSPIDHKGATDYSTAAEVAVSVAKQVLSKPLPEKFVLNVNIPYCRLDEIRGIAVTRQGLRIYRDALVEREDPRGRKYYWIGGDAPTGIPDPGTDFWALENRYVSVSPLSLDLTDSPMLPTIESWELML
ncbi:MAG: 5'/3'-nucleotidase SurE [Anaerolineales bacterium]|nr:5'/3'-nucleotidase SurE [Anaerolineales bacterium]